MKLAFDKEQLGHLNTYRHSMGLSMRDIAKKSGLAESTVMGIFNGRLSPGFNVLQRLLDAMGLKMRFEGPPTQTVQAASDDPGEPIVVNQPDAA